MRSILLLFMAISLILFSGCKNRGGMKRNEIIIFHAGSLSVPFKQLADEYEKRNPELKILREPAGSLICARKVTELKKPCDIIASADYFVINELLIPEYASWNIRFATNEMVLAFQDNSRFALDINPDNWFEILLNEDVVYSRADPDSDPGGYRTVLSFMLAEKYYEHKGLTESLTAKNSNYIRPKEVDLIALLESNSADYIFIYKSVARQHNLRFVELPDYINLGDPAKNDIYNSVSIDVAGSTPVTKMTVKGEYINYSLSVLSNSKNKDNAIDFVSFILSREGMEILKNNGQEPIVPFSTEQPEMIPEKLKKYLNSSNPDTYDDKK